MLMVSFGDLWQPYVTNVCFKGKLNNWISLIWNMKGDPSFETIMRTKDSISKIKDLSSLKCHKEMKDIWFS